MKNSLHQHLTLACLALAGLAAKVQAESGVWTNTIGGPWSAPLNWTNSVVADGAGFTADFSTVDLVADTVVTLDSSRTVGAGLTLATGTGGSPSLSVTSGTNVLALPVSGTEGFTKSGGGLDVLDAANPLFGTLNIDSESFFAVNDGAVRITSSAATANVDSPIRFRNNTRPDQLGSTLQLDGSAGSIVVSQEILMNGRNHPSPQRTSPALPARGTP